MVAAKGVGLFLLFLSGVSSLSLEKERPVTKVINLLKDMSAQLEKEAEQDEKLFEDFKCWCTTYDKEKTTAIETAKQMIDALTSSIEEGTAKQAQLKVETESLQEEVAEKMKALEEASGIREKEGAEFSVSEQDLSSTIGSLGGAVKALGAAHGEGLTQESLLQVQHVLKHPLARNLMAQHHSTVTSFLQQSATAQQHEPQSGAIFGVLKGMKEAFEANLETSRKDETTAVEEYGQLKIAKNDEVAASNDQIDANIKELAETKVKLSNDKESLEDTQSALTADTAFLDDLKTKCGGMDEQWEARQKMRNDEVTAVSETIKILNDDEAHDTMGRSLGFAQVRSSSQRGGLRRKLANFLRLQNQQLQSPRLAMLVTSVKDDVFSKVKASIENLIQNLKVTQQEEMEERDYCVKNFNENEDQTVAAKNNKDDLEQRIEDLKSMIASAQEAIAKAKQEIHETHVAMKQAGGNRAAQNKEFQMTVQDARATQAILKKALDRLAEFYKNKAALLQRSLQAPAAPAGFGEYKKAGGATGAMGLLEMIIKESAATERKAIEDEQEAQTDYESFMKDSFASINALSQEITDKSEQLAKADGKNTQAETDLANTADDIFNLGDQKNQLHRRCDYMVDNFEVRQKARAEEIESLEQGAAMLSGAKLGF